MLNTAMPMMSFAFGDNNSLRTHIDENGNPWFMAKDVCTALGLENNRKAVERLNDRQKITVTNSDGNPRAGIPHSFTLISESGLYTLSFTSRKPEAKIFCEWVCDEVLPSLRKTGTYSMPNSDQELLGLVQHVKPAMRERLLMTAQRVTNMSGSGSPEDVERLFARYCRLVTEGYEPSDPKNRVIEGNELVSRFVKENLEPHAYGRLSFAKIVYALKFWWEENADGPMPSDRAIGTVISKYYTKIKSNGIVYTGVRFIKDKK